MALFVIIVGLCVGSFLNVCIYRLPLGKSVANPPRSFCPSCNHLIPWYYNIPVLSYILLRGKCRFCSKPISWIYPSVEIITAVLFFVLYVRSVSGYQFFSYAILCSALIVSTFVDIKHRIIPDEVSVGGIIAGFLISVVPAVLSFEQGGVYFLSDIPLVLLAVFVVAAFLDFKARIPDWLMIAGLISAVILACCRIFFIGDPVNPAVASVIGIIIGAGLVYITGVIGDLIFRKESMGGGDVKLLAMIGSFLGYKHALLTFLMAPFFGLGIGIYVLLRKKDHTIPYGPFLSLAALASIFWYNNIMAWVFPSF